MTFSLLEDSYRSQNANFLALLGNNSGFNLAESDFDLDGHEIRVVLLGRDSMYCRQTDGQDFLPLVRHLNDAAGRQRRFDVGAMT